MPSILGVNRTFCTFYISCVSSAQCRIGSTSKQSCTYHLLRMTCPEAFHDSKSKHGHSRPCKYKHCLVNKRAGRHKNLQTCIYGQKWGRKNRLVRSSDVLLLLNERWVIPLFQDKSLQCETRIRVFVEACPPHLQKKLLQSHSHTSHGRIGSPIQAYGAKFPLAFHT